MRSFLFFALAVLANTAIAQRATSGLVLQFGSAAAYERTRVDDISLSGPAVRLGYERTTIPSRDGFSIVYGAGLGYDQFRRISSSGVNTTFVDGVAVSTQSARGITYRLLAGRAYGGVAYGFRRFTARARLGVSYLVNGDFQGFRLSQQVGEQPVFNGNAFRTGLGETVDGVDGRYRVDFPSRLGTELGADVRYEIGRRWELGLSFTMHLYPTQPTGLFGEFCDNGTCPALIEEPFRNFVYLDRPEVLLAVFYDLSSAGAK